MGGSDSEIIDATPRDRRRGGEVREEYKESKRQIIEQVPLELSELRIVPVSRCIDQPDRKSPTIRQRMQKMAETVTEYFRHLRQK